MSLLLRLTSSLAVAASSASAASYSMITWGDWGTGSSIQREAAAAVNKFCAADASNCATVVSLGDQFYDGPLNVSDKRFQTEFAGMYTFTGDFHVVMGNHDYKGSVQAQLDYDGDARWKAVATNYTLTIPEADLTIVFVDTPRACPSYMSAPYGDCNENCMLQLSKVGCTKANALPCWLEHVAWLNRTLEGVTTRWKFVAGHHPIDQENMPHMTAALAAHGVQAYLAGHIHNMQHDTGADGVQYFISGAGAFTSAMDGPKGMVVGPTHDPKRRLTCPEGNVCSPLLKKFFSDGPGFLSLRFDNDANPPAAWGAFVHYNGTVLYNTTFNA